MRKPRGPISHSAGGEPETMALLNNLQGPLEENEKFSVCVDKNNLQPGDPWRQNLATDPRAGKPAT